MKRLRPRKPLLWTLALAAIIGTGLYLNAKEGAMPKKIMMYYGGFEVEEMFDASQWFASGMYQPRHIEADGGASNVTMLRSKPMPFTSAQYEELPLIASSRLRREFPELERESLLDDPPDLSKRVRYAYSAFAEPNKPQDYHNLFLELHGQRYVITFARDARSGAPVSGGYAEKVVGEYASQAEYRKAFAEVEEAERKAR
jgi:hypothetical protein